MGRGARPARYVGEADEAGPEGLEILVIGAPNLRVSAPKTSMASSIGGLD